MNMGWHVQVCKREWVMWGYGERMEHLKDEPIEVGSHIDPAAHFVRPEGIPELVFLFELPKNHGSLPQPQEYGRKTCWGWRIRSNELIHDCGWHLAYSKEDCIQAVKDYLIEKENNRDRARDEMTDIFEQCVNDIREYDGGII